MSTTSDRGSAAGFTESPSGLAQAAFRAGAVDFRLSRSRWPPNRAVKLSREGSSALGDAAGDGVVGWWSQDTADL